MLSTVVVYPSWHTAALSSAVIMSGGGVIAPSEDEMTKLQRYVDERENELRGIRGELGELKAALRGGTLVKPFTDAAQMQAELRHLRAKEASTEQLMHDYNQQLLLLQQGAAGGCIKL